MYGVKKLIAYPENTAFYVRCFNLARRKCSMKYIVVSVSAKSVTDVLWLYSHNGVYSNHLTGDVTEDLFRSYDTKTICHRSRLGSLQIPFISALVDEKCLCNFLPKERRERQFE